jgi:hypothetical protein
MVEGQVRARFNSKATIHNGNKEIPAKLIDISVNGALIEIEEKIEVGTACEFELVLGSGLSEVYLIMPSEVVRHTETGLAVTFSDVDDINQFHLENLVKYNTENLQKFFEQRYEREHKQAS